MREFFKGWRRKTGCVTLVMACVFALAWLTSVNGFEFLRLPNRIGIVVLDQKLIIGSITRHPIPVLPELTGPKPSNVFRFSDATAVYEMEMRSTIHFVFLVIPLTLLSAWLLVTKPVTIRTVFFMLLKFGTIVCWLGIIAGILIALLGASNGGTGRGMAAEIQTVGVSLAIASSVALGILTAILRYVKGRVVMPPPSDATS